MATITRNQEQRVNQEALHTPRSKIKSQRGVKLPYIEARDGFVQRWVRTKLDGHVDDGNVYKRQVEGWQPRLADTVPKGSPIPKTEFDGASVIGMHNMVLMERPQTLHDEYREEVRDDIRRHEQAINNDVMKFRGEETGRQMSGITSEVHGGKTPSIAPD